MSNSSTKQFSLITLPPQTSKSSVWKPPINYVQSLLNLQPQLSRFQTEDEGAGWLSPAKIGAENNLIMRSLKISQGSIQAKCEACAAEEKEEKEETIQTKLTIGTPPQLSQFQDEGAGWLSPAKIGAENNLIMRSLKTPQGSIQPKCEACEKEKIEEKEAAIQPKLTQGIGTQTSGDLESRLSASKGGGAALAPSVRAFMEPRFGTDFSGVRVHTGSDAVQMNREIGAQAFTHGRDVYFGEGKSPDNNELTAHELTHVVQQTGKIQAQNNNPALPQGPSAGTSSTTFTLNNKTREVHGATLTQVYDSMTNSGTREAASVKPELKPDPQYEYDDNDKVTKAVVTVKETKEMPKWAELDKQCQPIKDEWNRFYGVLDKHEDNHVAIDRKHYTDVHQQLVGKQKEAAWAKMDAVVEAADQENEAYDTKTNHGLTEGTKINGAVQCGIEKVDVEPETSGTVSDNANIVNTGTEPEMMTKLLNGNQFQFQTKDNQNLSSKNLIQLDDSKKSKGLARLATLNQFTHNTTIQRENSNDDSKNTNNTSSSLLDIIYLISTLNSANSFALFKTFARLGEAIWAKIPEKQRGPAIDKVLQALLSATPYLPIPDIGRHMLMGALKRSISYPEQIKINIINRLIKLFNNDGIDFYFNYFKGLLEGLWEGFKGPFVLLWDLAKLELMIKEALMKFVFSLFNAQKRNQFRDEWNNTYPIVEKKIDNFIKQLSSDPKIVVKMVEGWIDLISNKAEEVGQQIADKLLAYITKSSDAQLVETIGWLGGNVLFEVLLYVLTEGGYAALKAVVNSAKISLSGIKAFARAAEVIEGIFSKVSSAFRAFSRLLRLSSKPGAVLVEAIEELINLLVKFIKISYGVTGKAERAAGGAAKAIRTEVKVANTATRETHEIKLIEKLPRCSGVCEPLAINVSQRSQRLLKVKNGVLKTETGTLINEAKDITQKFEKLGSKSNRELEIEELAKKIENLERKMAQTEQRVMMELKRDSSKAISKCERTIETNPKLKEKFLEEIGEQASLKRNFDRNAALAEQTLEPEIRGLVEKEFKNLDEQAQTLLARLLAKGATLAEEPKETPDKPDKPEEKEKCPKPRDLAPGIDILFPERTTEREGKVEDVIAGNTIGGWWIKYKPKDAKLASVMTPAYNSKCEPLYIVPKPCGTLYFFNTTPVPSRSQAPAREKALNVKAYPLCWSEYQPPVVDPVGLDRIQNRGSWVAGHLINGKLGGPGSAWNLIPIPAEINNPLMYNRYEQQLTKLVKEGTTNGKYYWFSASVIYFAPSTIKNIGHFEDFVNLIQVEYGEAIPINPSGNWSLQPPLDSQPITILDRPLNSEIKPSRRSG